jgi:hypothetical protein
MVTRWAYEAESVEQFRSNKFEKPFFKYDMEISQYDWYASFLIPNLKVTAEKCATPGKGQGNNEIYEESVEKLAYHINDLAEKSGLDPGKLTDGLYPGIYNESVFMQAKVYLDTLSKTFRIKSRQLSDQRNFLYKQIESVIGSQEFVKLRENHYNEALADIVLNRMSTQKIYDSGDRFIQKADPVYMNPGSKWGRAHYFAPFKQIGNLKISTIIFNLFIIWIMNALLFIFLYYNLLNRFIVVLESLKLPILRKYGRNLLQVGSYE